MRAELEAKRKKEFNSGGLQTRQARTRPCRLRGNKHCASMQLPEGKPSGPPEPSAPANVTGSQRSVQPETGVQNHLPAQAVPEEIRRSSLTGGPPFACVTQSPGNCSRRRGSGTAAQLIGRAAYTRDTITPNLYASVCGKAPALP